MGMSPAEAGTEKKTVRKLDGGKLENFLESPASGPQKENFFNSL
jgi:hypothetical protein